MQTEYVDYEAAAPSYVNYENPQKQMPILPIFRHPHPEEMIVNEFETQAKGHTVYVDMIFCEIRIPANRELVPVFPANAVWKKVPDAQGVLRNVTYAQRFKREFDAFMRNEAPSVKGIPIEELPFLGVAKRMELKGLGVVTVEILAGLSGSQVKNLGIGGNELVAKAQAFLAAIDGTADVTKLASENVSLKAMIEALQKDMEAIKAAASGKPAPVETEAASEPQEKEEAQMTPFDFWSDEDLAKYYATETGKPADGRWSRAKLLEKVTEASKGIVQ